MRTCIRCGEVRPESEYYIRRQTGRLRGTCKQCCYEQARAWRLANPEKAREHTREWMSSEAGRFRHLRRKFGLTPEIYRAMLVAQNDACAVCRQSFGDSTPHVDHDHETGRVRGLLCRHCNTALGQVRDDASRLRALANYLDVHAALVGVA